MKVNQNRAVIEEYLKDLEQIGGQLTPGNHAAAVALANVPDEIRGYGHVKEKAMADAKELRSRRWEEFRNPSTASPRSPASAKVTA